MAKFGIPANPSKNTVCIDNFRGVDFRHSPANVNASRAVNAKNFIRGNEIGTIRKRTGYQCIHTFEDGPINGIHEFMGKKIYHVGTKLLDDNYEPLKYETTQEEIVMEDARSSSANIKNMLFIIDGKRMIYAKKSDEGIISYHSVSEEAYVPKITIGRHPQNGGGEPYEPINLLTAQVTDCFYAPSGYVGGGTVSGNFNLQLSMKADTNKAIVVERLKSGSWNKDPIESFSETYVRIYGRERDDDGASDNYRVTYYLKEPPNINLIENNTIMTLFGVNGFPDRLFVAGDPDNKNIIRYSEFNNSLYFPDTYYNEVGGVEAPISGCSMVGTHLAIHKNNAPDGRNIYLCEGTLDNEGVALFRIINSLYGLGSLSNHCNAFTGSENLFLTKEGVYAVTSSELTLERYSQSRSLYINERLSKEENLTDAFAHSFKGFYFLCVNNRVYALDTLQKTYSDSTPYSQFQYECYYLDNIPARVMYDDGTDLYFGSADGKIYKVYSDVNSVDSYNDDGKAIEAVWETPEIDGGAFFLDKTFRYISLKLGASSKTGAKIFAKIKGLWKEIFDSKGKAGYLDWNLIDFNRVSFSSDTTSRTVGSKIKIKKVDKVTFRIENKELNEPCKVYALGIVYTKNNYFKG